MDGSIAELSRKLGSLQTTLRDVQGRITATSGKKTSVERINPPQPHTLSIIIATIGQLQAQKTKLQEEITALKERLKEKEKAKTEAAATAAKAKAEAAAATATAKAKAEATAATAAAKAKAATAAPKPQPKASTAPPTNRSVLDAPVTSSKAAPNRGVLDTPVTSSKAAPNRGVLDTPVTGTNDTTITNNRSNKGIDQYTKEHHDYMLQQIEEIEKQIEELNKKDLTAKKDNKLSEISSGIQWRGGYDASGTDASGTDASGTDASGVSTKNSVDTHIVNLEARIVELEKRVKQLEENCCNGFTESLIDQNKRKIANLKKQIELLKNGMYLDIFGELYHTIKIDSEGTEQPYDGILTLNAFFRNFGLDRRYVNETAAKDKWSREYVDDVLKVFNKYFGKDTNPYAVFKSQLINDKEKDSSLLCPHLKRRYETIQRDIVRETVSGSPMNPSRLEGVGHYYRRVWEDLDAFLRETQICKGKISLPETPLKQPQFRLEVGPATAAAAAAATAAAAVRKSNQPTRAEYQLPSTKRKQTTFVKEGQAPPPKPEGALAKFLRTAASPSDTTLGQRIALPREDGKSWKMFPSRTPKSKAAQPTPLTLHLINHLANNLGGPVLYPEPHKITLEKIPQLALGPQKGFVLKAMPTVPEYVKPNTTVLVNYLLNELVSADPNKFKQMMSRMKLPSFKRTQSTGYERMKNSEPTPLTLHLINHLANNLGGPVLYPQPHKITLQKIPQLSQFALKAMPTVGDYVGPNTSVLANYLLNELGPVDSNKFKQMMSRIKFPSFKRTQSTGYERMKNSNPTPLTIQLINHLANNLGGPMLYPEPHRITLDKIPQLAQFALKAMPTIGDYVEPNTTALVNYLVNIYGIMGVSAPTVVPVQTPPLATSSLNNNILSSLGSISPEELIVGLSGTKPAFINYGPEFPQSPNIGAPLNTINEGNVNVANNNNNNNSSSLGSISPKDLDIILNENVANNNAVSPPSIRKSLNFIKKLNPSNNIRRVFKPVEPRTADFQTAAPLYKKLVGMLPENQPPTEPNTQERPINVPINPFRPEASTANVPKPAAAAPPAAPPAAPNRKRTLARK